MCVCTDGLHHPTSIHISHYLEENKLLSELSATLPTLKLSPFRLPFLTQIKQIDWLIEEYLPF